MRRPRNAHCLLENGILLGASLKIREWQNRVKMTLHVNEKLQNDKWIIKVHSLSAIIAGVCFELQLYLHPLILTFFLLELYAALPPGDNHMLRGCRCSVCGSQHARICSGVMLALIFWKYFSCEEYLKFAKDCACSVIKTSKDASMFMRPHR